MSKILRLKELYTEFGNPNTIKSFAMEISFKISIILKFG
jgi:hypothetical protein